MFVRRFLAKHIRDTNRSKIRICCPANRSRGTLRTLEFENREFEDVRKCSKRDQNSRIRNNSIRGAWLDKPNKEPSSLNIWEREDLNIFGRQNLPRRICFLQKNFRTFPDVRTSKYQKELFKNKVRRREANVHKCPRTSSTLNKFQVRMLISVFRTLSSNSQNFVSNCQNFRIILTAQVRRQCSEMYKLEALARSAHCELKF